MHITEDLTWTPTPCHSQEGTTAPTLFPPAEKSKFPPHHPHHILRGHHWECADQLPSLSGTELQCCWPQDPPADSEHGCKDHRCPSPIHPGHFLARCSSKTNSIVTDPTHPSHSSSSSYHQEDGTGASEPAPPDCSTAFSPGCWEPWTQITPPPLWNPMQTPTSWNMDHPPPPPPSNTPNLTTPRKKLWTFFFFCNSKCATHRWVGLYKPPVVTHFPLCTKHFS